MGLMQDGHRKTPTDRGMSKLHKFQAEKMWLAPMSGSTDAPFRRQVSRFGDCAVVSEMVAGEQLARARPDMVRRICRHDGEGRWIVQLAARDPRDMLAGAQLLRAAGVDQIDINMGCPSKQVTGGQSGSALMREPELARSIIEAAIEGADGLPVTLKMRLGWDDASLNAPSLAESAVAAGIVLIAVHGRTRCQFYTGQADWHAIRNTVDMVNVPVIANGDICNADDARAALLASNAHGVMVGRAVLGQPWLPAMIAADLSDDKFSIPDLHQQAEALCEQIEDSLSLYGTRTGLKTVRKHVAASIDRVDLPLDPATRRDIRGALCRMDNAEALMTSISDLYLGDRERVAA